MSKVHLTTGSVDPPRTEGLLRLYSMHYCPFAHRSRLVLKAKGIPHEIVNINLISKPEWYFQINSKGLVPALVDGSKTIVESLDICNYLDETYHDHPLYPLDLKAKQKDKELIEKIGPVVSTFAQVTFGVGGVEKRAQEWLQDFLDVLQVFEDELAVRRTPFFGGEKPGMVDLMLWPWAERAPCVSLKLGEKLPFQDDQLPLLRKWRKSMREDPVVSELYVPPEKFYKITQAKLNGEMPPYDSLD